MRCSLHDLAGWMRSSMTPLRMAVATSFLWGRSYRAFEGPRSGCERAILSWRACTLTDGRELVPHIVGSEDSGGAGVREGVVDGDRRERVDLGWWVGEQAQCGVPIARLDEGAW
jgi:hypothetical protein